MDIINENKPKKTYYTYILKKEISDLLTKDTAVTISSLTNEEEIMAINASKSTHPAIVGIYLAKFSIKEIDGKPVNWADGSLDEFWNNIGSKGRTFIVKAYGKIVEPQTDEEESFFASQKITVK